MRRRLGESLDTVQQSELQLQRVTSPNLKAVQLYTQAYHEGVAGGNWTKAADLSRQAVAIDPGFASGHDWLAVSLLNSPGGSLELARSEFEEAARLSLQATDRERLLIRSNYSRAQRQDEKARGELETLLRAYPEERWAAYSIGTLTDAEGQKKFWEDIAHQWPTSSQASYYQAVSAIILEADPGLTRAAIERATSLAATNSTERGWLDLAPACLAWRSSDGTQAALELDKAVAVWSERSGPSADAFNRRAGQINLALGRVQDAEARFRADAAPVQQRTFLAFAALARNDPDGVVKYFEGLPPPGGSLGFFIWTLGRAGRADQAEAVFQESMQRLSIKANDPQVYASRLAIELARGRVTVAASLAREAQRGAGWDWGIGLRLNEVMAEAFLRDGNAARAAEVLEVARANRSLSIRGTAFTGYNWLRTQALLTRVYRRLGRGADAEAVEKELSSMLERADPSFPIREALRSAR